MQKSNDQLHHHHQDQLNHHLQDQLNHHQDQLHHHHHHQQDQLNHHQQDQLHHQDHRIASNDFAYTVNSISSLIDPSLFVAPPRQPDACTSEFRYDVDIENLSFEEIARDLKEQQERLQLKVQQQQPQDQRQVYYYHHPQEHQFTNFSGARRA